MNPNAPSWNPRNNQQQNQQQQVYQQNYNPYAQQQVSFPQQPVQPNYNIYAQQNYNHYAQQQQQQQQAPPQQPQYNNNNNNTYNNNQPQQQQYSNNNANDDQNKQKIKHQIVEHDGDEGGEYYIYFHSKKNISTIRHATEFRVLEKYHHPPLQNNARIVIYNNKITHYSPNKNHWFYMCVGTAVYDIDKPIKLKQIDHFCVVWHWNNRCHHLEFDSNNKEKCLNYFENKNKKAARAIIYKGEIIDYKQPIIHRESGKILYYEKSIKEWLKSAVGYYYWTNQ